MSFTLGQLMPDAWKALHIHIENGNKIRAKRERAFRMSELKRRGLIRKPIKK